MNAHYKVPVGNGRRERYVYFDTLDAARQFCNEVARVKNIFLTILAVKP